MIWVYIASYVGLLLVVSYIFRRDASVDEYLMARRNASTIEVTFGLFTLIGGGELVTVASLGFLHGISGIALFVGYSAAFIFLGLISSKIRKGGEEFNYVSLPDYVHKNFGLASGFISFIFSFLAFFALLMLQFATAGEVISPITGMSYIQVVSLIGVVVLAYLLIGGFKAVLVTDIFQGMAMILLVPAILFATKSEFVSITSVSTDTLPFLLWLSLVLTGFFVATASADVWQRIYAAKDNTTARRGLFLGGISFIFYGLILVYVGIAAKSLGVTSSDSAFVEVITNYLPSSASTFVIFLVLSAVMSTSDTEMFLLTAMVQREIKRFPATLSFLNPPDSEPDHYLNTVSRTRIIMLFIGIVSILFAFFCRGLVDIYIWLLSAIIVISPIVLFSLFKKASSAGMFVSMLANTVAFAILVFSGYLNIDNIYIICIPGIFFYLVSLIFFPRNIALSD